MAYRSIQKMMLTPHMIWKIREEKKKEGDEE